MIYRVSAAAALLLTAQAGLAEPAPLEEAAARFGARESLRHVSLSPSGTKLALISPLGTHGEEVYVVDLEGDLDPKAVLNNVDPFTDLDYCDWATEARLVCGASMISVQDDVLVGLSRLAVVDTQSGKIDMLSREASNRAMAFNQNGGSVIALDLEGKPNSVLMTREYLPQADSDPLFVKTSRGLGVDEVDIETRRATPVERGTDDAVRFIADEKGRVRIKILHPRDQAGNLSGRQIYYYRSKASDSWERLAEAEVDAQSRAGFYPLAADSARDVVFGFDARGGYDALYAIALDGSGRREEILARDDVDVDRLIRIGRKNRVVGVSYATEKRQIAYIDPGLGQLAEGFANALPGTPLIDIVDASQDESRLLVIASSDTHPGTLYLYDKASRQLDELLPLRNELAGTAMGAMTPVSFPAADGTPIPGYLTLPPGVTEARGLPAIVLPHGGPSARDEWGFDWLVQFFAAQGYAVLQPNYRGSSGYGSAWFGRNGFQAWETAIGDVNDAGRWLVAQGMADPDRLAIVGWSYGGYAALQSQVVDPQLYKAVVAIAPVTDLELLRQESRDFTSYALVNRFIGRGAHVRAGSPANNAEAFAAPVLLFHGTTDQNVGVGQSQRMRSRLEEAGKQVTYVEFKDLDHGLDDSKARVRMLTETAQFLTAAFDR